MYHVSAQGVDERMINVHYNYYYYYVCHIKFVQRIEPRGRHFTKFVLVLVVVVVVVVVVVAVVVVVVVVVVLLLLLLNLFTY